MNGRALECDDRDCVGSLGAGIKNGDMNRMRRIGRMLGQLQRQRLTESVIGGFCEVYNMAVDERLVIEAK